MYSSTSALIVEDNELNARLIRKILESAGYEMFDFRNAEDALKQMAEIRPDLILLDLQLPGMSGYEFAERIRSDSEYDQVKIIAISANVRDENKKVAYEAGCDAFIEKPINTRTLIKDINAQLEKSK